MGYGRKVLMRSALLKAIFLVIPCSWCFWMGMQWTNLQIRGFAVFFYLFAILLFIILCISFIEVLFPQKSKWAKSIMRYEKYEGEGNVQELLREVDEDVAHVPTFGSIKIGSDWMVGRTGIARNAAIRRESIRAVFYFYMEERGRGASGIPVASKEYALLLVDTEYRETIFLTVKEKHVMAAYRMLLRHQKIWKHGDLKEYEKYLSENLKEKGF